VVEFVCKVGTPGGEVVERSFTAADEPSLRGDLERQGFYLFSVRSGLGAGQWRLGRERVKDDVILLFAQEMAALLKAGLPLVQALDIMLERQRDPLFKRSLSSVRDKVRSGVSFSDAFLAEGERFPPIFSASLVAGERSGNLEGVLRRFVQYLRVTQTVRKKAISAAMYPAAVVTMMLVLITVMVVKVIPAFEGFYTGFGAQLPFATRALLGVSAVAQRVVPWALLLGIPGLALALLWYRRDEAKQRVDRWLVGIPFLGPMMRMYATSQLARTLATLLQGGLPLLKAMDVAANSVSNRAMGGALREAAPLIREGKSLMFALESTQLIEPVALEMVKVGEQTGALADMLNAISDFFDEELETRVARVLALIEPIMLVVMAIVVGSMLLAFYLPMFQIFSTLSAH
jgi:type IV pilus assembly protein PilC